MRTASVVNAAIAGCLILAVSGCVYIPPVGERVRPDDVLFVKTGATTRDELRQRLGPSNILDGSRVSVYQWQTAPAVLIVLSPRGGVALDDSARHRSRLLVEFDESGKVRRAAFAENAVPPRYFVDNVPEEIQRPASRQRKPDRALPCGVQGCAVIAVSANGELIAAAGAGGKVDLWNTKAGRSRTLEAHITPPPHWGAPRPSIVALEISPDGMLLAAAGFLDTTVLWDLARGEQRHVLRGHSETTSWIPAGPVAVAFGTDGRTLATGGRDGVVKLWNVDTGSETAALKVADAAVQSLAFAPAGDLLAIGTSAGEVMVIALASGKRLKLAAAGEALVNGRNVAFSPTGETLAANSCVHAELWDVADIRRQVEQTGASGPDVTAQKARDPRAVLLLPYGERTADRCRPSLALSPGARVLIATSTTAATSLWDIGSQRLIAVLDRPREGFFRATLQDGGAVLVSVGGGGVRITELDPIIRSAGDGSAAAQGAAK